METIERRNKAYDYDLALHLAAGRRARAEAFREAGRMIASAVRRLVSAARPSGKAPRGRVVPGE
ncbi:MAG: hypothetical protein ACE37J_00870 [Pikeienuella sp.]|uniref:hypothetical protein n=1 Tax=Pikeienuella sp. TaxID=2831957 RepID=UPI00391D05D7